MAICLKRGARDLHMVQLIPLSPIISCFIKIQTGLTFLLPAYPDCHGKEAVKRVSAVTAATILKPGIERVQALADISRSGYVVIVTKPVHRLQIRPIVHN